MNAKHNLSDLRNSIDNLDNALVAILAERFRLTEKVGFIKATQDMPAEDTERERKQILRYSELASFYGLNKHALIEIMQAIIAQVKKRHIEIWEIEKKKD